MRDLVKAAKALSDETRLRILNLLLVRECCVCEVMQVLNVSQTRASRNLNLLYDAGFLKVRREGLWAYYSIDKSKLKDYLSAFINAVELGLSGNEIAADDRDHLKEAKRLGPQCCTSLQAKQAS
ncbi:MAG TPA: metalloregulator ArsR/SmtB family transcription factor [Dehalococcoidia bacterium]|nr:metalloregulator ArsR/SmtB family transcription factor [Dehalococcoidia bacterium]